VQDIFGFKEDRVGIFNLKFKLSPTTKAGKAIVTEPLFIKVTTEVGKLKSNYVFDQIDINKDRLIMFRSPMPAMQDMKIDIYLHSKTKDYFEYYKLTSIKYSLIFEQKGGV